MLVSAPLMLPVIGDTGRLAAAPKASRRNCIVHGFPLGGLENPAACARSQPVVINVAARAAAHMNAVSNVFINTVVLTHKP